MGFFASGAALLVDAGCSVALEAVTRAAGCSAGFSAGVSLTDPVATLADSAGGTTPEEVVSAEGAGVAGAAWTSAVSLTFPESFGEQASVVRLRTHAQKKPNPARRLVTGELPAGGRFFDKLIFQLMFHIFVGFGFS